MNMVSYGLFKFSLFNLLFLLLFLNNLQFKDLSFNAFLCNDSYNMTLLEDVLDTQFLIGQPNDLNNSSNVHNFSEWK